MSSSSKLVEIYKGPAPGKSNTDNDYVVHNALVSCTRGSQNARMVFPDRGYDVGYHRIGLATDTSADNFSNTFGRCKCTDETCEPCFVGQWVETDNRQNANGGYPLLMKSMLVCKRGGILSFKECGQNIGEKAKEDDI